MRKSIVNKTSVNIKQDNKNDEKKLNTCLGVVEHLKAISKSTEKCIENVMLIQSQYPTCSTIVINLVDALNNKMTSTYISIEGEGKFYKNKKIDIRSGDPYFLNIKPNAASPLLYQLLENIYINIRDNKRIPHSLQNINIDDIEEKTLNKGSIYINKLAGAVVEYININGKSTILSVNDELDNLTKRDKQIMKLIVVPIIFYKNGNTAKVTFGLKKLIIDKNFSANIINVDGTTERVCMTDNFEDDIRGLGIMEKDDDAEDDDTQSLFGGING
ncbi:protein I3 [BeAn 58058 virus]|uniref:protein I3 n=1 Tax=BeAn 58058 virus TaxID=67082 RepID=UPI000909ECD2|nr:protein I3 [BeAn 58058 virus]APG58258.1 protein I3 [BeAn 58058 virus]